MRTLSIECGSRALYIHEEGVGNRKEKGEGWQQKQGVGVGNQGSLPQSRDDYIIILV